VPQYQFCKRLGGPQGRSGRVRLEKNCRPFRDSNPKLSNASLIVVQITLFRPTEECRFFLFRCHSSSVWPPDLLCVYLPIFCSFALHCFRWMCPLQTADIRISKFHVLLVLLRSCQKSIKIRGPIRDWCFYFHSSPPPPRSSPAELTTNRSSLWRLKKCDGVSTTKGLMLMVVL
jgi:hypothetical protein